MKRLIIIMFMLLCAIVHTNAQSLVVRLADKSSEQISLTTYPKVLLTATRFVIVTTECEIEYPIEDIDGYYFIPADLPPESDAVILPEHNPSDNFSKAIEIREHQIFIRDISSPDVVRVFDTDGLELIVQTVYPDRNNCVSLNSLPVGIYIVRIGKFTAKFINI